MSKALVEEVKAAEAVQAQKVEEDKLKVDGEDKPKEVANKDKSENRDWKRNGK